MTFKIGYKKPEQSLVLNPKRIVVSNETQLQEALWSATAGTTIYMREGEYFFADGLWIDQFGEEDNYISIENYPFETPCFVNTQIAFGDTARYLRMSGITVKDRNKLMWDGAVYFFPGVQDIIFENNEIYNITCDTYTNEQGELSYYGCNPLVLYGDMTYPTEDGGPFMRPISNVIIRNNYIHDCVTGWSEALTLEGNVENCQVIENTVENTGNIGIDLAGNFPWTGVVGDPMNQPRDCYVARNLVKKCQSPYATSGGIYCDGSRNVTIEQNIVYDSQCGIELGAEEPGNVVENFHVRNNLIVKCGRGIGVGAYLETGAEHRNSYVYNNTIICTDVHEENNALVVERTDNLHFKNNIIVGVEGTYLYQDWDEPRATNIHCENNCYYGPQSLSIPSHDVNSFWSDPKFVNNNYELTGDYHLQSTSSCLGKGLVSGLIYTGFKDLDNNNRVVNSKIDLGCYQYVAHDGDNDNPTDNVGLSLDKLFAIRFNKKRIEYIYHGTGFIKYRPRKNRFLSFQVFQKSSDNVVIKNSSNNSIEFIVNNNATWDGIYYELPKAWIGKPIMMKIGTFRGQDYSLMVQDSITSVEFCEINEHNKSATFIIPETCEGASMYIQNKDVAVTSSCVVSDMEIYVDWLEDIEPVVGDNLFPTNWNEFTIEDGVEVISSSPYNIEFMIPTEWTGIRWNTPDEWLGRKVTFGCESFGPIEYTFAIQSRDNWEFIDFIKVGEYSKTIYFPDSGNYQIMLTTEDVIPTEPCRLVNAYVYVDGVSLPEPNDPTKPPIQGENVFPTNWSDYSKDTGVVILSSSDYNVSFSVTDSWQGINTPLSSELLGKTVVLGCAGISPTEFTLNIQNTDTWEFVGDRVDNSNLYATLTIPSTGNFIVTIQSSKGVPSEPCELRDVYLIVKN